MQNTLTAPMKTTLSHLPENKQEEIQRIAEIIREVVNPEMIILFGSYAKGTYVEDRYRAKDGTVYEYVSDYDFLVVTKDNKEKVYDQESKILDKVHRYKPPVNLEIREVDYINEGLEWGQYFFSDIVREGIALYNTGKEQFVEPRVLDSEEERKISQQYYDTWYKRGKGFISGIDAYIANGEFNIGAFILHQAAESFYYTALLVFTGYKPKTHNLRKLRKQTKNISEELFLVFPENNKSEEHLFELLRRGYVDARYKDDYSITLEELTTLTARLRKMQELVERISKERIENI